MNPLVTATDLVQWADRRAAQGELPLLLRRLVRASVAPQFIDFPAGDSVNRPGYDGTFCATVEGSSHVPAGQSVWEMGTDALILGSKASERLPDAHREPRHRRTVPRRRSYS